jgi:hypothetical protein
MLHRLVYISRAPERLHHRMAFVLTKIEKSAQRNNANLGVTGALIYANGVYVQALEGPRSAVSATFQAILNDDRHQRMEVIAAGNVEERWFAARPMLVVRPGPEDAGLLAQYCPVGRLDSQDLSADALQALLIYYAGQAERPALALAS